MKPSTLSLQKLPLPKQYRQEKNEQLVHQYLDTGENHQSNAPPYEQNQHGHYDEELQVLGTRKIGTVKDECWREEYHGVADEVVEGNYF